MPDTFPLNLSEQKAGQENLRVMHTGQTVQSGSQASSYLPIPSVSGWLMHKNRGHPSLLQGVQFITGYWHTLFLALGTVPGSPGVWEKAQVYNSHSGHFPQIAALQTFCSWDFSFNGETLLSFSVSITHGKSTKTSINTSGPHTHTIQEQATLHHF